MGDGLGVQRQTGQTQFGLEPGQHGAGEPLQCSGDTAHEVLHLFLQQWKNNQEKEEQAPRHQDKHDGDRQSPADVPLTDADFF